VSKNNVSEDEKRRILATAQDFSEADFQIDDNGNHTMPSLVSTCRAIHYRKPLSLIVVDYLGLISPGKEFENRQTEMAYVSRCAKMMAKELKVPVLALAQLNREVEKRAGGKPTLADLRDSGALEQDADVVLTIHREGAGESEKNFVNVAKNRHGEAGLSLQMNFEKRFLKWSQSSGVPNAGD
jgi:replicative DNA helicase